MCTRMHVAHKTKHGILCFKAVLCFSSHHRMHYVPYLAQVSLMQYGFCFHVDFLQIKNGDNALIHIFLGSSLK